MHSILVLDGSSQACSFAAACLWNHRQTTVAATSTAEASNLMRLAPPDVLIANLAMEGMMAFIASLRSNPATATLPVIGLSDPLPTELWQQAAALGIRHFLPKDRMPVGQLQACVDEVLRELAKTPQLRRGAA